ncbi:MAG TPA: flagellar basal-body MS-ring/collar protein FliF [Geminicoccaceae bacterium]|nr:flagellar basal-body MS-ring/collar protein FliF [Geminicoccus sp.]HMU49632.1 flagellar basal-body MS-ring/collar protein FliF [Geminicoccaceae bacterium]
MERAGQAPAITADAPSGRAAAAGAAALAQLRMLGPGRILALGAVALAMLGFFSFLILRAVEQPYTLLFGGMDLADSRQLVERLDTMGVPYRLSPDGGAVMVPADQALRLRMSLAEDGLPTGGTIGDELFDQASGLTTTDFLSDVSLRRALEGELARTIAHLEPVRSARVHLVQPKRELFRRDAVRASASIVLSLARGAELDKRQVAGIRHLVAGAVPGLDIAAVSILDDRGNLLARPDDGTDLGVGLGDALDYRAAYEDRLRQKLLQLLERSVGIGRVDVEVSADFDFDEVATTAETYDPESQVARSTQTVEESTDRSDTEPQEQVSVANNLPTEEGSAGSGAKSDERTKRTEETSNFEISRTVRNEKRRGGVLKQLSIAVQVDNLSRTAADGTVTSEPRPAEELEQLEALVRSAAGVDERRGDVVRIIGRPFVAMAAEEPAEERLLGLGRDDWWRMAELGTMATLGLVMLLFGVRPAIRRLLPAPVAEAAESRAADPRAAAAMIAAPAAAPGEGGVSVVLSPAADQASLELRGPAAAEVAQARHALGLGRAAAIDDVAQFVVDNPAEAVRVVRGWLHGG